MADVVACRCRGNCGLHDGTCGRPVEQPHDAQDMAGGVMGTWYQTGLCEACWKAIRPRTRPVPEHGDQSPKRNPKRGSK